MWKNTLNLIIDSATLLLALAMVATGLLLKFVLPPGSRGGQGLRLWGLGRHDWGDLHFVMSVALGALLLVHVALHWTWVCAVVSRWLGRETVELRQASVARRWLYGVSSLLAVTAVVVGFLWSASISTVRHAGDSEGDGCACRGRNATASQSVDATPSRGAEQGFRRAAGGP